MCHLKVDRRTYHLGQHLYDNWMMVLASSYQRSQQGQIIAFLRENYANTYVEYWEMWRAKMMTIVRIHRNNKYNNQHKHDPYHFNFPCMISVVERLVMLNSCETPEKNLKHDKFASLKKSRSRRWK